MRGHFSVVVLLISGTCFAAEYTEVTGYEGRSLRINCHYPPGSEEPGKYFCRLQGFPCPDLIRTTVKNSWDVQGRFALFDNTSARFFTLEIFSLHVNDSGKYWCGVDISLRPDVISGVQITVKGVKKNRTSEFTIQNTVEISSPAITVDQTVDNGPDNRPQQSHFRFLAVIIMTCVGMLFFVCVFSLVHVLKRINSCNLSVSASYNLRDNQKSDPEHTEDDYVRMKPGVGRVHSPAAEDKNSPSSEPYSSLPTPQTGATVANMSRPEIDPYYLDPFPVINTDLVSEYIDPNAHRLGSVYENLKADSIQEPVYQTVDLT
ncbi:CMRF35-like molecule 6 isoform X1 [Pygocentrus nattereri]|uniref:CMRF35-like molecule 6 isoform X1 n=1 Tax=Pygocentrus nattereri TaxID=42514 RepID=UPI001891E9A2|nr:CMRF35-like molecule 6 isoform X1 [Pygocentrus nattereri]